MFRILCNPETKQLVVTRVDGDPGPRFESFIESMHFINCGKRDEKALDLNTATRTSWTIQPKMNNLSTLNNVGSKTLFNAVFIRPEQVVNFWLCIRFCRSKSAIVNLIIACFSDIICLQNNR